MRTAAALVVLAAVATAAAAARPPRSYLVTVHATLQERATYTLTGDAACFWSARGIAVRHLDIATPAPVRLTSAQLARGAGVPLVVHEIRLANHNDVTGSCPSQHLGADVNDPIDRCGKRVYRIPAAAVTVRVRGDRLAFSFVRIAADPYRNRCAPSVWAEVPQSGFAHPVETLRFPPKAVSAPLQVRKRGAGEEADAAWSRTVSTADATVGRTDVSTTSWHVALTFG